jgi:PPK2 family polyphosphate:nucleotide phosphotransferase
MGDRGAEGPSGPSRKRLLRAAKRFERRYRVSDGKGFRLKDFDPGETAGYTSEDKPKSREALAHGVELLAELQDRLYAQDKWAILLIFQAMDAAGKDGAIKHVMSGVNPTGCQITSFKAPTSEDLDHDFLWRCMKVLPNRGNIGIFNRSYYEETLVVRVHPEYLVAQKLPKALITERIWKDRFHDMRAFERYLGRNGIVVRKFFLYVSRKEQKRRFLERLENPDKNWKFSGSDVKERGHWREYMNAYEETIRATATKGAPWYVVPADNKWFTRIVVASVIVKTLEELNLAYPKVGPERRKDLAAARRFLLRER